MRPVRSTLVSPTAATYTSLAIAAKDNLRSLEERGIGGMKRARRVFWILLVLLAIGWWLYPSGPKIEPGSVLVLDIEGSYVESTEPPLLARLTSEPPRPF